MEEVVVALDAVRVDEPLPRLVLEKLLLKATDFRPQRRQLEK